MNNNEFTNSPGVYVIVNRATDKVFVRASINVRNSVTNDITQLSNGEFDNEYLQCDWNEFGEDVFEVRQVIACPYPRLEYWEGYMTAKFNADCFEDGYN